MAQIPEKTPSTQVIYKDFDLWFQPHPVTGDVSSLTNEAAIKRSVQNLILMNFGDVPFEPNLGSNVSSFLFELPTNITVIMINNYIREVLRNHEPRVTVTSVDTTYDFDNSSFETTITFGFANREFTTTFDLTLERRR